MTVTLICSSLKMISVAPIKTIQIMQYRADSSDQTKLLWKMYRAPTWMPRDTTIQMNRTTMTPLMILVSTSLTFCSVETMHALLSRPLA